MNGYDLNFFHCLEKLELISQPRNHTNTVRSDWMN
jgi:hypothetical protein